MPKLRVIIKPPPEPQGDAEQQTAALRDYLLQMSEELAYVLTHLEADNINDSTFERIQGMIPRPYTGLPVMDGDASAGQSEQWARGDHRHGHDSTKADVTALEETAGDLADHVADTGNPHEVTAAQVGLGNVANERQYSAQNPPPIPTPGEVGAIPTTEKGSAGGVAELDSNGMVPSAQLPSYVDDVLEYASLSDFPATGESGKIYVALDTGRTYRWSGSSYTEISESLALGETSSTAYRGDRGKTAYDHSQTVGNPHGTTAADVGARPNDWMPSAADVGARPDTWMPTASDVGARPDTWTPSAADVGARPDDWVPDAEDVPYDNTGSGLMATDVQAAIDELAQGGGSGSSASAVSYDNTGSGLTATNVQDALDEVVTDLGGKQAEITASGILMGDGQGGVSAATAGTDYQTPLMAGTDYVTPAQLEGKANQAQLAYVETGNTASRAYSVGEHFCWNGLLYRATTAISSGGTFTPGTNCEQVPEGGFNRVWKDNYESTTFSSLVNCNSCSTPLAVYQTLMASSKAVGYGEIGNQQTSQLKSFLTNPYANYTNVTFEFISAGLIRCTARNASAGSILGKVCYLKGTINNLSETWTVTDWEDVDGAIGHKEVTLTTATLGTSFSPTSRLIGSSSTLFGVAAEKILSIIPRDNSLSPSANLVCGFYAGNFYLAATQSTTLSSSVKFLITYIK